MEVCAKGPIKYLSQAIIPDPIYTESDKKQRYPGSLVSTYNYQNMTIS